MAENFFGNTDTGRMRNNNEDAFIVQSIEKGRYVLGCVIDGVGGYEGGEIAANIARETISDHLKNISEDPLKQMKEAIILSNEKIYHAKTADPDKDKMACVLTLSLADLEKNQFYYAHVGDTRLYLFRDHSLVKVTRDHSFVGFLEDNKKLSEHDAMNHPKRNEINKALGFDPSIASLNDYIDTGVSPFLPGDLLMLCSDGLSDLVDNGSMRSILAANGTLASKTGLLIKSANNAGGKDNITVVMIHNNKKRKKHEAMRPVLVKKNEPEVKEIKSEPITPPPPVRKKKKNYTFLTILILLVLLMGTALVLLWQRLKEVEQQDKIKEPQVLADTKRNAGEQKLADSINSTSSLFLFDSLYAGTLILSDTILITRDSLHLKGNGNVIQSDSSFHGAAFVTGGTKYLLLENLVFKDFDIGISSAASVLRLKNIRFENCRIPVQSNFKLTPGILINGSIADSVLFRTDSTEGK